VLLGRAKRNRETVGFPYDPFLLYSPWRRGFGGTLSSPQMMTLYIIESEKLFII
jgi:hypothetical protein